jgi:hypothetical protein
MSGARTSDGRLTRIGERLWLGGWLGMVACFVGGLSTGLVFLALGSHPPQAFAYFAAGCGLFFIPTLVGMAICLMSTVK